MEKSVLAARLAKVQAQLEQSDKTCFMVSPSSTMKYLTGYGGQADERLLLLVLAKGKKPFIIANKLCELQICTAPVDDFIYWKDGEDAIGILMDALQQRQVDTSVTAVDKSLAGLFLIPISQQLKDSKIVLGNSLVDGLRVYKDEAEMAAMASACQRGAEALEATISRGKWWLGKTEVEFMAQLSFEMAQRGLKDPGSIVAVGANAAAPHHMNGQTLIEEGKCLLIDFGASYENYYTDMTRTYHFGQPSDEFKKVYDIVLEANRRGKEAARVGNLMQDVDRAARDYITAQGYGPYFTHRTGHGIGIDIHEGPPAAEGETTPIAVGMAFSIEPGIYLPGKFGIRIEDQALITKDGLRILHDVPRELCII